MIVDERGRPYPETRPTPEGAMERMRRELNAFIFRASPPVIYGPRGEIVAGEVDGLRGLAAWIPSLPTVTA